MNRFTLLCLTSVLCLPIAAHAAQATPPEVPDSSVIVSEGTLDEYAGTYLISPGVELKVWRQGEELMVQATGQDAWALVADAERVFRVPSQQAKFTFGFNARNEAAYVVILIDGRETKAVRK